MQQIKSPRLIIGCPIYQRDWIFPYWISCIQSQSVNISDIGFVFVVSRDDTQTTDMLTSWSNRHPEVDVFDLVYADELNHFSHVEGQRHWTLSKYENMVNLRNLLLNKVREYQPEYFFSLDSDILISNPSTLELLIAHIKDGADAVSPLMFMTPTGYRFPSVMKWIDNPGEKAHRDFDFPLGTYFQSDVIMAAKMMSKNVYNKIDYCIHQQGEDLGWSGNCAKNEFKLYSASYIYAIHVMNQAMMERIKRTGDERQSIVLKSLSKV